MICSFFRQKKKDKIDIKDSIVGYFSITVLKYGLI